MAAPDPEDGRAIDSETHFKIVAFLPHMFLGGVFSRPLLERRAADTDYLQRYVNTAVLPLAAARLTASGH
ncbi:hypothetical protein [Streptomyces sp. A5-4]|uniref:hypothetical protein n=1 Tax=Streptomyces sp. A5-4 TaxID=3384771 RepID=UPI003DA9F607